MSETLIVPFVLPLLFVRREGLGWNFRPACLVVLLSSSHRHTVASLYNEVATLLLLLLQARSLRLGSLIE